jgi:hypothetical protein
LVPTGKKENENDWNNENDRKALHFSLRRHYPDQVHRVLSQAELFPVFEKASRHPVDSKVT